MPNPMVRILLLALVACVLAGFGIGRLPLSRAPEIELPLARTLTNLEGKSIPAMILGRSDSHVRIRRTDNPNPTVYDVPLHVLSDADRIYVERFIPKEVLPSLAPPSLAPGVAYQQRAIEQLKEKIERISREPDSTSLRPNRAEEKFREIDKAMVEIQEIEADIKERQAAHDRKPR